MRFLFVMPLIERFSPNSGGAVATITACVANELMAQGHEVEVIAPDDNQPVYQRGVVHLVQMDSGSKLPRFLGHLEARLRAWDWPGEGRYLRAVWQKTTERSPDVVVLANDLNNASEFKHRFPNTRLVVWLHNECAARNPSALSSTGVDAFLCCSHYVREAFLSRYQVDSKRVHTAYAGVDADAFYPRAPEKWSGILRVLFAGRLDRNKGVDLALDAVHRLQQERLPVHLSIAGDAWFYRRNEEKPDPFVTNLGARIRNEGHEWYGHVPRHWLPNVMQRCDVALILSRSNEPFGLVALEAMACGLAVIASNRGGLPEACGDAAILLDPEDNAELDQHLRRFCLDQRFLQKWKVASSQRASVANWKGTADALLGAVGEEANSGVVQIK